MLKTIEERQSSEACDLDSAVRAFEIANLGDQSADIEGFLPEANHPEHSVILRELIRLDMEFSWGRGAPRRVDDFRNRYPSLFSDPSAVQELAFEEYRLRLGTGERPSVSEYAIRYQIDCSNWPVAEEPGESGQTDENQASLGLDEEPIDPTRILPACSADQEMRNAALAYTVFRLSNEWPGTEESNIAWSESAGSDLGAADFFRELHESDPAAACRLAQATAIMPECGTRFLDFELVGELGRGTFGRVFLAKQGNLAGRSVALKITAEQSVESRALAQLQHTHIVPVYSVHRSGPFHAVVMPYFGSATLVDLLRDLKGQETQPQSGTALVSTLHARIQGGKARSEKSAAAVATIRPSGTLTESDHDGEIVHDLPIPASTPAMAPSEVLQTLGDMSYVQALLWIGTRIADALAHAHERGILHRDLKPANILLTDQGPMLLDFNLAADTKGAAQATAARLGGTLPYMAPEHLDAFRDVTRGVDGRSDIYSLGVILYELLCGRRPYATLQGPVKDVLETMIQDRRFAPPSLSGRNKAVTPAIEAIIARCLQADPALRYQTARHLQEDLHRQLNDLPLLHIAEPSFIERSAKWYRRNRKNVLRGAVAAAAVAVFALGGLMVRKERDRAQLAAVNQHQILDKKIQSSDVFAKMVDTKDSEEPQKAREQLERDIENYEVLANSNWKELPAVANLKPPERKALLQDMGQLLVSLAQSQLTAARSSEDGERNLDKVQLYCDRAGGCFDADQVPSVLSHMRAELAGLSGDKKEADRLQKLAAATPVLSSADRLMVAMYEFSKGKYNEAIPGFKLVTEQDSKNVMAWCYLGNAYSRLARYSEAVPCYSVCMALAPQVNHYRFDRGLTYHNLGDYRAALGDFNEFLNSEPENLDGLLDRSLTNRYLGRYPEALADLRAAAALPDAPEARIHFMASNVYASARDNKSADREIELGLKATAISETDWIARGLSELRSHPERALEDFNEALQINPSSLGALRNKALALSKLPGRTEEAIAVLDDALRLYPGSVLAWTSRGTLLARLGKRDLAIQDAEQSLKLDSRPEIRYRAAGIYASTSRQHSADAVPALGNLAAAFKGGYGMDLVASDTDLEPIKSTPEFQKLWAGAQVVQETAKRVGVR